MYVDPVLTLVNPEILPFGAYPVLRAFGVRETRPTIRAQDDVVSPCGEGARQLEAAPPAAVNGKCFATHFPAVAVRTLKDGPAEQLLESRNRRQDIHHAGGDQQFSAGDTSAAGQSDLELAPAFSGPSHLHIPHLDLGITGKFPAANPPETRGLDRIAR